MWTYNHTDELMHYGVMGMKWGVRRAKKEARANYKAARRKALDDFYKVADPIDDKYDFSDFGKGGKGYSKEDKAAMDKADADYKSAIKKAKADYKNAKQQAKNTANKYHSDDAKEASRISKKRVSEMSNAELRKLNERMNLERQYSQLNPGVIKSGAKAVATAALATTTILTLYNNSGKLINIGKSIIGKFGK